MLDRTGKPNHLNMRQSVMSRELERVEAYRARSRKAEYAKWEEEWAADGTIPGVGLQWVTTLDGNPVSQPCTFAEAMYVIYGPWREEVPENEKWLIVPADQIENPDECDCADRQCETGCPSCRAAAHKTYGNEIPY